jgi:hypothetical protein
MRLSMVGGRPLFMGLLVRYGGGPGINGPGGGGGGPLSPIDDGRLGLPALGVTPP